MHSIAYKLLNLGGRNPQPGGGLGPIFRDWRAGDLVAVARAPLDGIARRHPIAVAIKQHASEEARPASFSAIVALGGVAGKLCLNRIPERLIDDRFVFSSMGLPVVNNLAAIDGLCSKR